MFDSKFLSQMAYNYQLSSDQQKVLLMRLADEREYEDIARELKTSAGACLKRMGEVYKKFGIIGETRGKENQLRYFLQQEYDRGSTAQKVGILVSDRDLGLAKDLEPALNSAHYQVSLIKNDAECNNLDCLLLLLSSHSAVSEVFVEIVKSARDLRDNSSQDRPSLLVIRVNFPQNTSIDYELYTYLQNLPQLEWRSFNDTHAIAIAILHFLKHGFLQESSLPSYSTWENSDGRPLPAASPELPEGQVDLESAFYLARPPIETRCYATILQPGALIRIKAPRQMGKTSLMARILHYAAGHQYTTIHLSFQLAEKKIFQNLEKFLQWFCANISYSLGLPNQLEDYWDEFLGSKVNCKAYFEQYLLAEIERPVVLGLDEVDLVFSYPEIAEDFLSLLRAWHEEAKRRDVWKKLRLVVVHSTEVYLPMDINQSPFNVGLPIDLPEFDREQVGVLAGKYGLNWENERVEKLMKLVGGHPYLVRLALYHIANKDITLEELIKNGAGENNLYSDHLKRHLWNLEKYPSLLEGIKQISISDTPVRLSSEQAFKLDSMGLIKFQGNEVIFRCQLYQRFFKKISEKI